MKLENLQDLFVEQLQDLYSAETQLMDALPKMAKAAHSAELKKSFTTHLAQTQEHAERLKRIFEMLDETPGNKKCKAMAGLIAEGEEMIAEDAAPEVKDAGLIAAAQRVEHYEMAGYGTVRTYAQQLEETEAADLLEKTLGEEKDTDEKLTKLAETSINLEAENAEGGDTKQPKGKGKRAAKTSKSSK